MNTPCKYYFLPVLYTSAVFEETKIRCPLNRNKMLNIVYVQVYNIDRKAGVHGTATLLSITYSKRWGSVFSLFPLFAFWVVVVVVHAKLKSWSKDRVNTSGKLMSKCRQRPDNEVDKLPKVTLLHAATSAILF